MPFKGVARARALPVPFAGVARTGAVPFDGVAPTLQPPLEPAERLEDREQVVATVQLLSLRGA